MFLRLGMEKDDYRRKNEDNLIIFSCGKSSYSQNPTHSCPASSMLLRNPPIPANKSMNLILLLSGLPEGNADLPVGTERLQNTDCFPPFPGDLP